MIQTILLVNGAVLGLLCAVGAALSLLRRSHFERERAAVRAGTISGEAAYRRYVRSDPGARVRLGLLAAGALLWLGGLLILTPPDITASLFAALLFPALPLLALPLAVYQVLVAALADAPAMTHLRGRPTRAGDLVLLFPKSNIMALSLYTALGLSALLCMVGVSPVACIVLVVLAYLATTTVRQRTRIALQRWLFPCTPLEESRWAALVPRAQIWAQRVGVEVAAVYVRDTSWLGNRESCVEVQDRRCALFVTEAFLGHSEWRQQDALLCELLAAGARLPRLQGQARQRLMRVLAPAIGLILVDLLLTLGSGVFGYSFLAVVLIYLMPIIYIAGVLVLGWRNLKANAQMAKQIVLDADRAAAELTGDPIAVMAAVYTEAALAGIPLDHRRLLCPTVAERLEALGDRVLYEGRLAPWATDPMPSIVPIESAGRLLTTALTDAAKLAPPPAIPEAADPVAVAADRAFAPSPRTSQHRADSKWGDG
jgi:hypothetical protein